MVDCIAYAALILLYTVGIVPLHHCGMDVLGAARMDGGYTTFQIERVASLFVLDRDCAGHVCGFASLSSVSGCDDQFAGIATRGIGRCFDLAAGYARHEARRAVNGRHRVDAYISCGSQGIERRYLPHEYDL